MLLGGIGKKPDSIYSASKILFAVTVKLNLFTATITEASQTL